MTKIIQFSNKSDVLYLRENSPQTGEVQRLRAARAPSQGCWASVSKFCPLTEEASGTGTGHDWPARMGFPYKVASLVS